MLFVTVRVIKYTAPGHVTKQSDTSIIKPNCCSLKWVHCVSSMLIIVQSQYKAACLYISPFLIPLIKTLGTFHTIQKAIYTMLHERQFTLYWIYISSPKLIKTKLVRLCGDGCFFIFPTLMNYILSNNIRQHENGKQKVKLLY